MCQHPFLSVNGHLGKSVAENSEEDCAVLCAAVATPPSLGLKSRQVMQSQMSKSNALV
jgi:hypothetical protein